MIRTEFENENADDMVEEPVQALDAGQLETAQVETRPVRFAEGDVVALKHNCMETLFRALFLAILREDHHRSNDGRFECNMRINWLEQSEEDL